MEGRPSYDFTPRYAVGVVARGWDAAVAGLPVPGCVLAVDGVAHVPWDEVSQGIQAALAGRGSSIDVVDVRESYAEWSGIIDRTSTAVLADDPDFERLCDEGLEAFFDGLPVVRTAADVVVVIGPGAALVDHDVLWYADVAKRVSEAMCQEGSYRYLGQRPSDPAVSAGAGAADQRATARLFFIDWPVLDGHRDALAEQIDRWLDVQDADAPASMDGAALQEAIATVVTGPFRTKPWFNSTVWGGHWAQQTLGADAAAENTAVGYELIAPESTVVLGDETASIEVPLQFVAALCPGALLGGHVRRVFGSSFPIRFDFLDTVGGGPLSVHCHPRQPYMNSVFGWPYAQHESYYVMDSTPGNVVYLGLRGDADVGAFRAAALQAHVSGRAFDVGEYVQTFAAEPHRLFLIPAGTPHASGEGNVVLEISATPYLYSLRFYDWLRRRADGERRPVHVSHAFANLNEQRTGERVASDLVQDPRCVRSGDGWCEDVLGTLRELFFEVRRFDIDSSAVVTDVTRDRFHVLNVVDGSAVEVKTSAGAVHNLAYAETLIVPAATGRYQIRPLGGRQARVVKAFVR